MECELVGSNEYGSSLESEGVMSTQSNACKGLRAVLYHTLRPSISHCDGFLH